jgi:UDP-glucuronate 4-epimerase
MDYIETLEKALGKKTAKEFRPMQPGDVLNTYCDVTDLEKEFGYRPSTIEVYISVIDSARYSTW